MADLSHWDFALDFTGEESASLIAGIDPAQNGFAREKVAPVLSRIERSYELAWGHYRDYYIADPSDLNAKLPKDALQSRDMHRKFEHALDHEGKVQFAGWLLDEASDFERQRFSRTQLADWLDAIGLTSVYRFRPFVPIVESAKADKHLNTTERNTLLTLVIGMSIKGYAYDPAASKSSTPNEIAKDLAALGMSITDDTVRKHLKQAVDTVLPANWCQP